MAASQSWHQEMHAPHALLDFMELSTVCLRSPKSGRANCALLAGLCRVRNLDLKASCPHHRVLTPASDVLPLQVSDSFPFKWINKKWKEGFYVTSMATSGTRWAVVMSRNAGFIDQCVELDFQYPSEGIHRRWDAGASEPPSPLCDARLAPLLLVSYACDCMPHFVKATDEDCVGYVKFSYARP